MSDGYRHFLTSPERPRKLLRARPGRRIELRPDGITLTGYRGGEAARVLDALHALPLHLIATVTTPVDPADDSKVPGVKTDGPAL